MRLWLVRPAGVMSVQVMPSGERKTPLTAPSLLRLADRLYEMSDGKVLRVCEPSATSEDAPVRQELSA